MDHFHAYFNSLVNGLGSLLVIMFVVFAIRTFKYVDTHHADYWRERRSPFLPSIDFLYNGYMVVGFLVRREYKALQDPALDKLADNARLLMIVAIVLGVAGVF